MRNKILLSILVILSISIILISCLEPTSPSAIVRKVYKAAENDDRDTFVKYCTDFKSSFDAEYSFIKLQDLRNSSGKIKFISENVTISHELIKKISDYFSIEIDTIVHVEFEYGKSDYSFYFTKIDGLWKLSGYSPSEFTFR